MAHRPIKVLVVDDSAFVRKALMRIFKSDPEIKVVGIARNGSEALDKISSLKPDVITLDIMMPVMDGIETLGAIMEENPLPVLMLSQYTQEGAELTLKALDLGAMDFVDKSTTGVMDFASLRTEVLDKVKAISGTKAVKPTYKYKPCVIPDYTARGLVDVVAIGTSTGGPPALQQLLTKFPKEIGFSLLVVQHMPKGFTASLADRLDSMCRIRVKEASQHDSIEPGLALIAPSGLHMKANYTQGQGYVSLDEDPQGKMHRPSADVLFRSVAKNYGNRSIGVILTGMGSDGADGIKTMKDKKSLTIAQDEETSVIFGMPKVAIERGGIRKVLPLDEIAGAILKNS